MTEIDRSGNSYIMSFASLGAYRLEAMKLVQEYFGPSLRIYAGPALGSSAIRVIDTKDLDYEVVSTASLFGRLLLQRIPFIKFLNCRVLLLDLNPRIPHVWALVILRRALHRPTILWGHAFPRGGREAKTESVRRALRTLSTGLVAYTTTQAEELSQLHPGKKINAAPNALYSQAKFVFDEESDRDTFIYVGRLVPSKKPLLLVQAFELALLTNPDIKLAIVGDGPLEAEVVNAVNNSPARNSIQLLGHIGEYEQLRTLYSKAIASVSPGYVGLSVTQSLSFGVPMIVSKDEPHAPEVEAIQEGQNAEFFATDDMKDLAETILGFVKQRGSWADRGPSIAAECKRKYSAEVMAHGLVEALEGQ